MLSLRSIAISCCVLVSVLAASPACPRQSRVEDRSDSKTEGKENSKKTSKARKRAVWNLDGGVFFSTTDGHLSNGSCFRLSGQMTAPDFFQGLRRIDDDESSSYTLNNKIVTEYPPELFLIVHILDFPCTVDLKETVTRPPLTRESMSTLRLNFFWKHGIAMRPVESVKRTAAGMRRLESYATGAAAEELAPRFEWNYSFTVTSEDVPLTNDLVLVIEDEDRKIAARTAARL
jgi:hypothetical protein